MKNVNYSIVAFLLTVTFLSSCVKKEDANNVGLEFEDENRSLSAQLIDSFSVNTSSIAANKFAVSNVSRILFGSYVDPSFGGVKNSIYTQMRLNGDFLDFSTQSSSGDANDLVVDSMIVFMEYYPNEDIYGVLTQQTVSVFEIEEEMNVDSAYLSDRLLTVGSVDIADQNFNQLEFDINDSIQFGGEMIPPSLIVRLNPSYGQDIINLSTTQIISKDDFTSYVKGLNLQPDNMFGPGQGCVATLNPLSFYSRVRMYYHDPNDGSSYTYDFLINDLCAYYSSFEHDYVGTDVQNVIDNPIMGNQNFYVQAGFGVQGKIDLPFLDNTDSLPFKIINRAILYIPVEENSDEVYSVPEQIVVTYYNDLGEEVFFAGHLSDIERLYNDFYNAAEKRYEINLTSYIQNVITGVDKNRSLYLSSANSAVSINRAVLNGQEAVSDKIKLEIVYTKTSNQ